MEAIEDEQQVNLEEIKPKKRIQKNYYKKKGGVNEARLENLKKGRAKLAEMKEAYKREQANQITPFNEDDSGSDDDDADDESFILKPIKSKSTKQPVSEPTNRLDRLETLMEALIKSNIKQAKKPKNKQFIVQMPQQPALTLLPMTEKTKKLINFFE
jgi:hypothetical protein